MHHQAHQEAPASASTMRTKQTMRTMRQYERLKVPDSLLGLSRQSWTRSTIQIMLDHYNWGNRTTSPTKLNMMHELHMLVQEYDLDSADRKEIFNARKNGQPLPPRKNKVRNVEHPKNWEPDRIITRNKARAGASSLPAATTLNADTLQTPNGVGIFNSISEVTSDLTRECVVCFEALSPENTPMRRVTSSCNHEPDVCRPCLATSISSQLDSRVWDQIDCPTCGQRLNFQDVKAFADSPVLRRSESSIKLGPDD